MEIREKQVNLFNQYLQKENKELKSILIIDKIKNMLGSEIIITETRLIIDKDKSNDSILEDCVSLKKASIGEIIYFETKIITNGQQRAEAADFIYNEYLKLCEGNFENKFTNYSAAVGCYNSSLIPMLHLFPSEQFK